MRRGYRAKAHESTIRRVAVQVGARSHGSVNNGMTMEQCHDTRGSAWIKIERHPSGALKRRTRSGAAYQIMTRMSVTESGRIAYPTRGNPIETYPIETAYPRNIANPVSRKVSRRRWTLFISRLASRIASSASLESCGQERGGKAATLRRSVWRVAA